jgi:hypothetical protein
VNTQSSKRFKSGLLSLLIALSLLATFAQGVSAAPSQSTPAQVAAAPITHILQIQPIILSNDDGSETARFFGSPGDVSYETVVARANEIWHQAGIHVIVLPPKYWNNTFANVGDPCEYDGHTGTGAAGDPCTGGTRSYDTATFIQMAEDAGVASVGRHDAVMDTYFVSVGAGTPREGADTVSGLGRQLNNSQTMYIGPGGWLDDAIGLEIVGNVLAHEAGHTLGLAHTEDDPEILGCPDYNIMLGGGCPLEVPRGAVLLPSQIAIALQGHPLVPVPAFDVAKTQISRLQVAVKNMSIGRNVKGTLFLSLEAARLALKNNKPDDACKAMKVFDASVTYFLSKGKLNDSQGRLLNTGSKDIRAAIGCQ